MKLSAIAAALNTPIENGSPDIEITGLNGIEQAGQGELTFIANPKYAAGARSTLESGSGVSDSTPDPSSGSAPR